MSSDFEELLKAEKDRQTKLANSANDAKTNELLPMLQELVSGCKLANGDVELKAEILCKPTCDLAVVKPWKAMFRGNTIPNWLIPRESETTILLAARYLSNGKIEFFGKSHPGQTDTTCECDTREDLFAKVRQHLEKLKRV
jgi:hypothetical protein